MMPIKRILSMATVICLAGLIGLTACSENTQTDATAGNSKNVQVSPNLPEKSKCPPSGLVGVYNQYEEKDVDSASTISLGDIRQAAVDYFQGVGCSSGYTGGPGGHDPSTPEQNVDILVQAFVPRICARVNENDSSQESLMQTSIILSTESLFRFLYGSGFGAVDCGADYDGQVVTIDKKMLTRADGP